MKRLLPYIFLFIISLPQLSLIGKLIYFSKFDKNASELLMENQEDFSEEDTSENSKSESESESEMESKKFLTNLFTFEGLRPDEKTYAALYCSYINHYNFFYSKITLPPPRIS